MFFKILVYVFALQFCDSFLSDISETKPILLMYTDGGPDHRLTYVSVQLSLIAVFIHLDLDILIAAQTAPNHSWANPVKRIMSVINLGLQCVGMMRSWQSDEYEEKVGKFYCSTYM